MTGSIISAVSIFLSSYSSSLSLLLLTYGVLGGVGLGLMYAPAVVTVGQYFKKRLNLATGNFLQNSPKLLKIKILKICNW